MAPSIKVGDTFLKAEFDYIPWAPELESHLACGVPSKIKPEADWKGKKVLLVPLPGAFAPAGHITHLPPFLDKYDAFQRHRRDRRHRRERPLRHEPLGALPGLRGQDLGPVGKWSGDLDLCVDLADKGLGVRTARYAMIIDDLVLTHFEVESPMTVTTTSADAFRAQL
ncbi:hypothetical protein K438DRAFT_382308 [Mycena galopus ATCC 62051]|nr:hypothetical protein K438DRAFT_382308 [Mycena galopus ATCC 62051]